MSNNPNLDKAKEIAEKQWNKFNETGDSEEMIGFECNGQFIINPWMDSSGRFDLTTEQAIKMYGAENIIHFIEEVKACTTA